MIKKEFFLKQFAILTLLFYAGTGCAQYHSPYAGVRPDNPQFERGNVVPPLDFFGDLISKPLQLLFWTRKYGNHNISPQTEKEIEGFLQEYKLKDVKVRINQWAPHKELGRLFTNKNIAWPYRIIFFPSTLIVSLLGRPLSGLIFSDYYDPGSNTINIFSDEIPIVLHESGHALDFSRQEFKGTYGLVRALPGVNLVQESIATDEALIYMEEKGKYDSLIQGYKVLYPAYATYVISYLSTSIVAMVGAVTFGHIIGRMKAKEKITELRESRKIGWDETPGKETGQRAPSQQKAVPVPNALGLIAALSSPRMRGGEWRVEAIRGKMREWKRGYPITASIEPNTISSGYRSIAAAS